MLLWVMQVAAQVRMGAPSGAPSHASIGACRPRALGVCCAATIMQVSKKFPDAGRRAAVHGPLLALREEHRAALLGHLLALRAEDRYLRFGHAASDLQIRRYVQAIDFARDQVFAVFDRGLRLVAAAHIARDRTAAGEAEFGVSVLPDARGMGLGTRLFARAAMHARNRGLHTLRLHCMSQNAAMMAIAQRAGMRIRIRESETEATLPIAPSNLYTRGAEWLADVGSGIGFACRTGMQRLRPAAR